MRNGSLGFGKKMGFVGDGRWSEGGHVFLLY
jgi:hypothetical protein